MKKSSRKRLLVSSVAMLLVAMLALGTATYAWFTTSTNPYADTFSATTTKRSTLLLSDSGRSDWTTHLAYNVNNKIMFPASGDGENWVMGTASNSLTGAIDNSTLKSVVPTNHSGGQISDYVYMNELNLKNNGTAAVKDVKITITLDATDPVTNTTASYARVALVPIDQNNVTASDYAPFSNAGTKVFAPNTRAYQPIIAEAGTKGTSITPDNTMVYSVTTGTETIDADAEKYYKLYVWFEGQDTDCVDAKSGMKVPNLKFDVTSTIVEE